MSNSKTYLQVPYAQKDAAKALGAKWDPAVKQWYVPADKDLSLFGQWQTADSLAPTSAAHKNEADKAKTDAAGQKTGVLTQPIDKNFVAYQGEAPPWD